MPNLPKPVFERLKSAESYIAFAKPGGPHAAEFLEQARTLLAQAIAIIVVPR